VETLNVRKVLFLIFFLALFLLVARLFYPFLTIMLWSGLIYVLLNPVFERIARHLPERKGRKLGMAGIAAFFSLAGVLLIMVPISFIAVSMARQVGELTSTVVHLLDTHPEYFDLSPQGTIGGFIYRLTDGNLDLSSVNLRGELSRFIAASAHSAWHYSGAILRNLASFLLTLLFMVFTLYFLFMDGRHLAKIVVGAIPIEREYTRLFMRTLRDTSRQLVVGYVLVALYQATAAFVIFSIFRVKGPLVLAALTAISSFVPLIGAGLVWLPVSLIEMATGGLTHGLVMLFVSGFFISGLDNFVRPLLLTQRIKLHPLLIFFSILGGIELFHFNGIILGPLILILFFAAVELYDESYRKKEPVDAPKAENPDTE
jgi:predicted PurR-regulated permease PerM